jgi:colanic acid/amylovoran biosynthesis protein
MKITIIDAYTWFNKGDAGILIGTINQINDYLTNQGVNEIEINVLSFTPDIDSIHYKKIPNVKGVYSNILNPYPFKKTKIGKIKAITKLAIQSIVQNTIFKISKNYAVNYYQQLLLLKSSDIIIVCGGGFLGGKKFNSLIHLHQINLAAQLGKPIYLWGTSIEPPTNKIVKYVTEKVIKKLDHVFPREEITLKYLSQFLDKNKYTFTPDLAFMVPMEINDKVEEIYNKLPKERNIIGLTVRNWHFPKSLDKKAALENYKNSIAYLIENVSEDLNASFVFIPQVIFTGDDDRIIAKEIKEKLSSDKQDKFIILEDDLSPQEIKGLISKFDIFVGTRMHSNIFATGASVPTVAIAYEAKTNGIMDMLKLSKYTVNIEDITPQNITELVKDCFENRSVIKEHLSKEIPKIQSLIRQQSEFLGSHIL